MMNKKSLIKSVQEGLTRDIKLPHQACSIAYEIFLLGYALKLEGDSDVKGLITAFVTSLSNWELDDLLIRQVGYAIRLAEADGKLEYEEMHKLFSLCDEIYALEFIGLNFDNDLKIDFEESIRRRFTQEKKKAKLVSEDKAENWQKELWWYKESLEG